MKLKELCRLNGFDEKQFQQFLLDYKRGQGVFRTGMSGIIIEDSAIESVVAEYKDLYHPTEERIRQKEQERFEEEQESIRKKKAMAEMLITSGFNFEGYHITKYSGYISGDDCVTIPRDNFWGSNKVADNLCGALVKIRRQALKELKEAAYALGCNAVIGVDFDYMTMDPQHGAALNAQVTVYEPYVICVTANGNAVVIEKEE